MNLSSLVGMKLETLEGSFLAARRGNGLSGWIEWLVGKSIGWIDGIQERWMEYRINIRRLMEKGDCKSPRRRLAPKPLAKDFGVR